MSTHKIYFKNLDSIRFIAALMVYIGHGFSPSFNYLPIQGTVWERLLHTVSNGAAGVSIFFVLSGFLITYLLVTEYEENSKISLKKFYVRRVLRIWPLYFLVVLLTFLVYPYLRSFVALDNPLASNIWYHLSFLSNFDVIRVEKFYTGSHAMSQNITWSVSIEEQFYLVWPLLFVFLRKKYWIYSIVLVIVGSVFFRFLNYNDSVVLYFHTLSVLVDLGIGGLMAVLIKFYKPVAKFFETASGKIHFFLFAVTFSLLFWEDVMFSFKYGSALGHVFLSISVALLISAQAITKVESKLNLNRISFANSWGKYTYGIYLLHPLVITGTDIVFRLLKLPVNNFGNLFLIGIIGLIGTLLLSKLSYKYYESKFLLLKSKFAIVKSYQ